MRLLIAIIVTLSLISCQSKVQQITTGEAVTNTSSTQGKASFSNVDVKTFAKLMKKKNTVILDVRTPEETALGKIQGAIEINVLDDHFSDNLSQLDSNKTYLVYCRSGRRSTKACNIMAEQGFTKLYNMQGGYNAWSAEN